MSTTDRALKFLFDRTVSLAALLFLWPLILSIAAIIAVVMPDGPPFFVQTRIGKDARPFKIIKLRTMFVRQEDRETKQVPGFVRLVRKYKLDELPQLWNVLTGKMSFVGPRPDVPGYADNLTGEDREILQLRPGITGPASLKYRSEEELLASADNPLEYNDTVIYPDKVRINRYYLHHYSFLTDLEIIYATVAGKTIRYGGETI